jgi:hypothetical protein
MLSLCREGCSAMLTPVETISEARRASRSKLGPTVAAAFALALAMPHVAQAGLKNDVFRWFGICHSVGYHAQECCPCSREGMPLYGDPTTQGYFNPRPRGPMVLHPTDYTMAYPSALYWQGVDPYRTPAAKPPRGEVITTPEEEPAPVDAVPAEAPESDDPPVGPDEAEPAPEPGPAPAPSASSNRGARYRSTNSSRNVSKSRSSRSLSSRGQRYVPGPQRSSGVQSR